MQDQTSAPALIDPMETQPAKPVAIPDCEISHVEVGPGAPHPWQENRFPELGRFADRRRSPASGFWKSLIGFWRNNARDRRRLRACACIDPRLAKDIGMTAEQLRYECQGPFWVPVPRIGADLFHLGVRGNHRV
jgi:uncharacterized protein YjiS (DUF1127 family)